MRLLLLALSMFMAASAHAQCSYASNAVDKFTGVEEVQTYLEKVSYPVVGVNELSFSLGRYAKEGITQYVLVAKIQISGEYFCLTNDSKIYILTSCDSSIQLQHRGKFECTETVGSFQEGSFVFNINPEQLTQLSQMEIVAVKIAGNKRSIEFDITGKNTQKERGKKYFATTAKCVL